MTPAKAFTLAELLIALVILGVIATFTIPKVLQTQQSNKYNAMAKEAISMISGSYVAYKANNTPTATTAARDLTPYFNYVRLDTASLIDHPGGDGANRQCSTTNPCFWLHSGAVLMAAEDTTFCHTNNYNFIHYIFDPDGVYSSSSLSSPGEALGIDLHYNGRINTAANRNAGVDETCQSGSSAFWGVIGDPTWFSWN